MPEGDFDAQAKFKAGRVAQPAATVRAFLRNLRLEAHAMALLLLGGPHWLSQPATR